MKVDLQTIAPVVVPGVKAPDKGNQVDGGLGFSEQLKQAFNEVNDTQIEADKITRDFLAGKVEDLHQVTIATQQANLALQLTVQIRNKIVDAYQEISRMQI